MRLITASAVLLFTAYFSTAQPVEFDVDPSASKVQFTLGDVLHTVHGTFQVKGGAIRFDRSTGAASGSVIVDAASGDSGSGARDSRMKKNILEVSKYPEITFSPDHVNGTLAVQGASRVEVHGLFRIHGSDHEVALPAEIEMRPDHMTATLHFIVPYVQWGMKSPSTLFLRVDDKVAIDVRAGGRLSQNVNEPR